MPLKRCVADGKHGWKWGDSGKCYTGPDGRDKAKKQGRAIERSKHMTAEQTDESPKDVIGLYIDEPEDKE